MEENGTGDRVECDVREYPPNSSLVEVVWQTISTLLSDTENDEIQSIVMSGIILTLSHVIQLLLY